MSNLVITILVFHTYKASGHMIYVFYRNKVKPNDAVILNIEFKL